MDGERLESFSAADVCRLRPGSIGDDALEAAGRLRERHDVDVPAAR